jgi:limonene-1,2-epoxide hydrolase
MLGGEDHMREDVIRVVEAYLNGLGSKDVSTIPFHPDVVFEGPLGPPIRGADSVRAFLAGLFGAVLGVRIVRHIVEGEWCASVFDFHTTFGVIPIVDCFHVIDGQIVSVRPYYDPRPIVEGMNRASA